VTRVALLPSAYPPAVGGVEELTRHLALSLRRHGNPVEVWTGKNDAIGPPTVTRQDDIVVRRFAFALPRRHATASAQALVRAASTLKALRSAVRDFRPDVLHVQCFGPNGLYATALGGWLGIPLVLTLQGETMMDDHAVFDHSILLRRGLAAALRRADAVTACSQVAADDALRRFAHHPIPVTVIPNGIEPDPGDRGADGNEACDAGPAVDLARPYVLAVGRVVRNKGFDLLLRAFERIQEPPRQLHLVLAGTGPELDALRRTVATSKVADRVHLPGRLSREQVHAAMQGAEAFVMPSRIEPFGIVVLEAWRAGVPVIASSRGGAPEFVREGRDGLLVDPEDTEALAGALRKVLDDPAFARRLGDGGRERVPSFTWSVLVRRYEECYHQAVDVARTRRAAVRRRAPRGPRPPVPS
jgi:glycogen synthase